MKNILTANVLKGHRTHIILGVVFVLGGLKALGVIDEGTYNTLVALLAPLGIATFMVHEKK